MKTCLSFVFVLALAHLASAQNIAFPPGSGVMNVKDYGAKGDGITDDTGAFRKALKAVQMHFQIIYVPNGTYLVTDTISWGAWITLQGQNRGQTIIRLKDNCPGYEATGRPRAVVRCMFNNNMSFSDYIRNLTVDTGKGNPGAIGVRFNTHNHGVLEDVTIRAGDGAGRIGLDMSETEFGPCMVRNVLIEGFDIGIKTPGQPSSAVFENITLKGQRVLGFENHLPVSVYGLRSENKVTAIRNEGSLAQLVLLEAELTGGDPSSIAIESKASHYLRNIRATGYQAILKDQDRVIEGLSMPEHLSGQVQTAFNSPRHHLNLPVKSPPAFDEPVEKWVVPDSSAPDDTAALQKAIDSGAETLCLPSNVQYMISDTIVVRGKVRRIIALKHHHGNLRALNPKAFANQPMLRIDGQGTEPIIIESVSISSWPEDQNARIEIAGGRRAVYLKYVWNGGITARPDYMGDLFIDEGGSDLRLAPGQNVWIRQHNPENNPFDPKRPRFPKTYLVNQGANVWVLGLKTEAPAVHVVTTGGAGRKSWADFSATISGRQSMLGPRNRRWRAWT